MPPERIRTIPVSGGLVTSRDASLLADGELSVAEDMFYKPNDPAAHKVPGRTIFNITAEAQRITGARYLEFDGVSVDVFLTQMGSDYRIANAGANGTFSSLLSISPGDTLDSVHYNNDHFLLNGVQRNHTVTTTDSSGNEVSPPDSTSSYPHSMLVNTEAPTVASTGSGTGFILSSGSTVTYWVEERYKEGSAIIKRNISEPTTSTTTTESVTLTGTGVTVKPVVTRPTTVNTEATHWALYATTTDGTFSAGAEISEVVIATTTIEDTRTGTDPTIPAGTTYQLWVANIFGTTQTTPRNGPAPTATTGDIFEDSLCLNDVDNPTLIRFSFADDPHSFPEFNFIRFETKEHDEVRMIRAMGNSLMIGLKDSLWRVNILPRPEDASFDTSRVKSQVEGAFGCVGPLAATTFSFGLGPRLAYVSVSGVVVANEAVWDVLDDDINWEDEVEISRLPFAVLRDNPTKYRLQLYYTPKGGTANTKALYFHYHPSHAKGTQNNFRSKVTRVNVKAAAAALATIESDRRVFTASDSQLFLEDEGTVDESTSGGIKMRLKTGDNFLVGIGGASNVNSTWVHHQNGTQSMTAKATLTMRNSGSDDVTTTDDSVPLGRREHTMTTLQGDAEAFQFGIESDNPGPVAINYFAIKHTSLRETKEG